MKILIFGKNGQVGWELERSLAPLGEVIALDRHNTDHCGDLADLDGIRTTISILRPQVIVNAAAYTAVDKAETDRDSAMLINAYAPQVIAEEATKLGALVVHYSTDYVFDGSGDLPWREDAQTAPCNFYGVTKLEGERAIIAAGCSHLIFRTSWVYSARGSNFAKAMLGLAKARENLSIIEDQIGAPTGAELLADVSAHAIARVLTNFSLGGVYHLSAAGETSWYLYARFVIDCARQHGVDLAVKDVQGIPSMDYPTAAVRPLNSRLDTGKLQKAFALHIPQWEEGVSRMLAEILIQ
ncbi:dTDP-4-dehydrorhamnose reductase [Pseudomonas sp. MWU16-30317]|uniref:dTDP-4-dehydrorhamnose reductase n=1 Tax=Pseudomonas sp. MWU16-30317 TaxID=2878095 RepID=UPI001CFA31EC|nr:dTDP-4-dehydrorhamnose reductase [Pseudomonas sp. MWU16-30317]